MLEGRKFVIFTDHKPLVGALVRLSDPKLDIQRRQLSFIAKFSAEVRHISGDSNVMADTLSQPALRVLPAAIASTSSPSSTPSFGAPECFPVEELDSLPAFNNSVLSATAAITEPEGFPGPAQPAVAVTSHLASPAQPVDLRELAAAQQGCPDCARGAQSPALRAISVKLEDSTLLVDMLLGVLRPLVPELFRHAIFAMVHNIAHPGVRASRRLISSRFVWPKMGVDIKNWCNECQACQRAKASNLPNAPVQPIPIPIIRFSHVHIDLVGPLPMSNEGFAYLFTGVDRSTRWAEAWPLRATTAADCAEHW
jgi:hypothetical protein